MLIVIKLFLKKNTCLKECRQAKISSLLLTGLNVKTYNITSMSSSSIPGSSRKTVARARSLKTCIASSPLEPPHSVAPIIRRGSEDTHTSPVLSPSSSENITLKDCSMLITCVWNSGISYSRRIRAERSQEKKEMNC